MARVRPTRPVQEPEADEAASTAIDEKDPLLRVLLSAWGADIICGKSPAKTCDSRAAQGMLGRTITTTRPDVPYTSVFEMTLPEGMCGHARRSGCYRRGSVDGREQAGIHPALQAVGTPDLSSGAPVLVGLGPEHGDWQALREHAHVRGRGARLLEEPSTAATVGSGMRSPAG